jgi:hypothetical protein
MDGYVAKIDASLKQNLAYGTGVTMKCFLGFHDWKALPWFWVYDASQMPNQACLRCGKLWYKYRPVMTIKTIEGRRTPFCMYEGQWVAKGYSSYQEMLAAHKEGIRLLLRRMK